MKSLKTIQTLSKIGRILSKIVFICCLVGIGSCVIGILGLAAGAAAIELGGETLESLLRRKADVSVGSLYVTIAVGIIMLAGVAVQAKFAERYFHRELADGTPFHADGAKELRRLGIVCVVTPVACRLAAELTYEIMKRTVSGVGHMRLNDLSSIGIGIAFLVFSLLCSYGASLRERLPKEQTR